MTGFAFHLNGSLSVSGSTIFIIKFQQTVLLAHQRVSWVFLGHMIKQGIFPNFPPLTSHEVSFFGIVFQVASQGEKGFTDAEQREYLDLGFKDNVLTWNQLKIGQCSHWAHRSVSCAISGQNGAQLRGNSAVECLEKSET